MLRLGCLLVAFLLGASLLHAQNSPLDSLRRGYLSATDPQQKADYYYEWAYQWLTQKPETGLNTADTLEQLADRGDALKVRSRAAYLRGMSYSEQGKYAEALPFHRQEWAYARQTNDLELQGKALNSLGNAFHNVLRNDSAIIYLLQSVEIKERVGNQKDLAAAYSNIGNIFSDEQAPDKAVAYLEKALAIRLSLPDGERSAIITYNNLSIAYNGQQKYAKAIEYAQRGYELAREIKNDFLAGVLAGSLSHLWMKNGNLDRAVELGEESIERLSAINRRSNLVFPYATLAEVWWRKGNYSKALDANQKGYAIMEELNLVEPLEVYYENFANIYEGLGNYPEALKWLKQYQILDDSLFNKDKLEALAAVEAKFETEKKEAQLARQQLQIERDASQKRAILIGSVAALLLVIGLFQYIRVRQQSRQREAELAAQLEHAEAEKLREMDTLKSTFFANISHEFRTPLTLIISPIEQMIQGTFKGDYQKYYGIIHRNGKRLLDLVNQLLDLSRLESGKMTLQVATGDLSRLMAALAGSFESLAIKQQIQLQIQQPSSPVVGFFDRDKVEKIIVNLIANAFKFTGEEGTIRISLAENTDTALITIQDTGIGIPADQLPNLFDRFTATRNSELQAGSGIGLALVKELVELHHGQIAVTSQEGEGTTFMVTLPLGGNAYPAHERAADAAGTPETNPESTPSPTMMPSSGSPTPRPLLSLTDNASKPVLLVAEDNADVRAYISEQLADRYQLIEAENGQLALEKALESTPDLIITDVMMPLMDGITLCSHLKTNEKTSHIPIVMLTARADQADRLEGLQTGADDYLTKPFDARELQVRVANLIVQRQQLQEHFRRTLNTFTPTAPVQAASMDAVFLQKVRQAIETNLDDETFSVVELGNQIGMSRSQLHRKLSALTGYSPNEVIRHMRLERGRQLLEKKVATVAEVAYLCGFNSPAYFIKCFREQYGITPGEL
ncbi:MAG: response regulator [Lewinellaceae bacterium]|nr:response regulator [Lewinellaceae bacterium]